MRAFERGEVARVVQAVEPTVDAMPPAPRAQATTILGGEVLGSLFEGALVERGGTVHASFGAPSLVIALGDEEVPAAKIARDAMQHEGARALLSNWAARFSA